MFKKIVMTIAIFAALFAAVAFAQAPALSGVQQEVYASSAAVGSDTVASTAGICGARATWELDDEGTLTISGTGAMYNWSSSSKAPWSSYASSIKKAVIEDGVVSIGENAFLGCSELESITVGKSVTTLNYQYFRSCSSLKNINVSADHESYSSIDGVLFNKDATVLVYYPSTISTSYTVPSGVTEIGESAFAKCDSLQTINIPASVKTIGKKAFSECIQLQNISIADGVEIIGDYAFEGCDRIGEFIIPATVKTIGEGAFYECENFRGVDIPDSVITIGDYAFYNCQYIDRINIGENVKTIGAYSFYECQRVWALNIGKNVETIGDYAFYDCQMIDKIMIPDGVITVGDYAFFCCINAKTLTIGSSVVSIGDYAFSNCQYYKILNVPESVTSIGKGAFQAGCAIEQVTLPSHLTVIPYELFSGCIELEHITLPSGVTKIDGWAFASCFKLKEITIPSGVTFIGYDAFLDCQALESIDLPSSLERIGGEAFSGCEALKEIIIPEGVTTIDSMAFVNCKSAENIVIPNSVTDIGGEAFGGCSSLKEIVLPNRLSIIVSDMFSNCYALEEIVIPKSVTAIYPGAFRNCPLKTVYYTGSSAMWNSIQIEENSVLDNATKIFEYVPLVVTKQPADTSAELNEEAVISVEAEGSGLKYQWYYMNLTSASFTKADCTAAEYKFTMSEATDGRQVYCIVTDKYGISEQTDTVMIGFPAKILTQPQQAYAKLGEKVTLSVEAKGDGLKYQWYYKDSGELFFKETEETKAEYSALLTEEANGRKLYCEITDKYGNKIETETVAIRIAATVTQQPSSTSAPVDAKIKFTVKALGDGLTYQWYFKDENGTEFVKSSAASATYTTTMRKGFDGREFYCVVTDKYGNTDTTETVKLTLFAITKQPKGAAAAAGKSAAATVTAQGEGLTYTWYVCEPNKTKFYKSSITSNKYSYSMTEAKSGRQAYCVVTDKYGNTLTSDTVTLSLLAITKQPVNAAAASGKGVSASVTAVGEGLTYKWYVCEPNKTSYYKSSTTTNKYSYSMTEAKSGRQAYCVVTDKFGNSVTSDTATLSLLAITKQPANAAALNGKTVSASVAAVGDNLTYKWYVCDPGKASFYKSSITSSTYSYKMTEEKSGRKVYCVVTNEYGCSVKSNTVTLTMEVPAIVITKQPVNASALLGKSVSASVAAEGEGLTYTWYVLDPGKTSYVKSSIAKSTYTFTMSESKDGRKVYCIITDANGNSVRTNTVTLTKAAKTPLAITAQPANAFAAAGEIASTEIIAKGDGLTYTWYVLDPGKSEYVKSSITKSKYSCTMTAAKDGRRVYCVVTDQYGESIKSSIAFLAVE